jgi:hypothetical protein
MLAMVLLVAFTSQVFDNAGENTHNMCQKDLHVSVGTGRYTPSFFLPRVLAVSEILGSKTGHLHTSRDFHLGASVYRQVFQRLFHITNVTTHDKTDGESLRITEGLMRLLATTQPSMQEESLKLRGILLQIKIYGATFINATAP